MAKVTRLFRPSEYLRPASVTEAAGLLERYEEKGRILAGGTDLMVEKDPKIEALIDISGLKLDYIRSNGDGVRIGAAVVFADIAASAELAKEPYSVLAQAAAQIGTPQIRNMATIGGNICSAVPSADSAPALLALDATLLITGPAGQKTMSIATFFKGPRKNALEKGELVTEIQLPSFAPRTAAAFIKKGRVAVADLALVNVAVRLTLTEDGLGRDVRIALGAVAPAPLRAEKAEAMLEGRQPQPELLAVVADQASREIKPISDIRASKEYRVTLSRVLIERALQEALNRVETTAVNH